MSPWDCRAPQQRAARGTVPPWLAHARPGPRWSGERRQHSPPWWSLLKETALSWSTHKDARLGAALAYYSDFSIGPLIVIVIAIAGLAFGAEAVQRDVAA